MGTTIRTLYAPKEGNSDSQYEDAVAHTLPDSDEASFTVALSDGASSAVFAREWARLLVAAFVEGFPESDAEVGKTVAALGKDWREKVESKATSWWAQEKLPNGSSATLLVVTWDRAKLVWEARAIGDVCVFLIRGNKLRFAFPLTKANKFNDRPALLSTEVASGAPFPPITRYSEKFEPGDRFLLMTDALAAYFLAEFEARKKPWHELPDSQEALAPWLKARRDSGRLKNDDVTLVDLTF